MSEFVAITALVSSCGFLFAVVQWARYRSRWLWTKGQLEIRKIEIEVLKESLEAEWKRWL